MARHVVTGCAGFIGSHLVDALLARGDEVVGVDRFSGHYDRGQKEANIAGALATPGFRLVEGDLCTIDLGGVVGGAAGVFHLAAQPGVRGSWGEGFALYARDNLVATQRVAEAAAGAGARLVWTSSSSVYGDAARHPTPETTPPRPISPYGVTKLACESLVGAYAGRGLEAVTLRLFTVYGPRQRPDMAFARAVAAAQAGAPFTVLGDGAQTRDVTYVGDAVRAALLAMEAGRGGAVYNVGGGAEVALIACLGEIERLAGWPLALVFAEAAAGDAARTSADTAAARRDLGWAPLTPFAEGIAAQVRAASAAPAAATPPLDIIIER